jgi:hypothetical protein
VKIIFLVLASNTLVNENDFQMQQKTWAITDTENIKILWVRGSDFDEIFLEARELHVPVMEKYENILEKTFLATKWISEEYNPDFIVRTNVSTYFDLAKTEKFLARMHKNEFDLMGYPEVTGRSYSFINEPFRFMSGAGIIFSRKAANHLKSLDSRLYTDVPDDVAISHFFDNSDIKKRFITRSNIGYTRVYFPHWYTRLKSSENAALTQDRFRLIHYHHKRRSAFSFMRIQWNEIRNIRVHDLPTILKWNLLTFKRGVSIRSQLWRK